MATGGKEQRKREPIVCCEHGRPCKFGEAQRTSKEGETTMPTEKPDAVPKKCNTDRTTTSLPVPAPSQGQLSVLTDDWDGRRLSAASSCSSRSTSSRSASASSCSSRSASRSSLSPSTASRSASSQSSTASGSEDDSENDSGCVSSESERANVYENMPTEKPDAVPSKKCNADRTTTSSPVPAPSQGQLSVLTDDWDGRRLSAASSCSSRSTSSRSASASSCSSRSASRSSLSRSTSSRSASSPSQTPSDITIKSLYEQPTDVPKLERRMARDRYKCLPKVPEAEKQQCRFSRVGIEKWATGQESTTSTASSQNLQCATASSSVSAQHLEYYLGVCTPRMAELRCASASFRLYHRLVKEDPVEQEQKQNKDDDEKSDDDGAVDEELGLQALLPLYIVCNQGEDRPFRHIRILKHGKHRCRVDIPNEPSFSRLGQLVTFYEIYALLDTLEPFPQPKDDNKDSGAADEVKCKGANRDE